MISSVTQTRSGKLVAGMAEDVTGEVDCGRAAAEVASAAQTRVANWTFRERARRVINRD